MFTHVGIDWKTDLLGASYNGTLSVTISGRTCQAWGSQTPHKHLYSKISDQYNYCRNPSLDYPGPWCYTTDPNVKYEYCPIYLCGVYCSGGFFKCDDGECIQEHLKCNGFEDCSGGEDELNCYDEVNECMTESTGLTYRGKFSTTRSGDKCLRWTDTTFQRQLNHSYCRNFSAKLKGPWCFISSDDWGYCEVPLCGIDWKTDLLGVSYNGTLNVTVSGRTCQAWGSQTPHKHLFTKISNQSNYCRNPSLNYPGPWCYTTDPNVKYEYCPIYLCGVYCSGGFFKCDDGECLQEHLKCNGFVDCSNGEDELYCFDEVNECMADSTGLTYRGQVSITQAGDKCLRWSDTTFQIQLNHTYCRNFSAKLKGPWCFISSNDWDYCNVSLCGYTITTVIGIAGASSAVIVLYQFKKLLRDNNGSKQQTKVRPESKNDNNPSKTLPIPSVQSKLGIAQRQTVHVNTDLKYI
ncbi:low density lipoprotein-related protein 2 [Mytilus galloprovincialis]|uniref:Low density lipoprotein-related protein 2 n=1 Tax=Mytilus galloprovincialis TaxID=29158 RepID=A0A8B6D3I4_MYTGA|nr:low density lipoprotein-related protein 2 [Mytilus galloprovincialis]